VLARFHLLADPRRGNLLSPAPAASIPSAPASSSPAASRSRSVERLGSLDEATEELVLRFIDDKFAHIASGGAWMMDLDDARDVLAVQGPETLDMPYIENWCATHGTSERLRDIITSLPEL
jgi:hypothetical protein